MHECAHTHVCIHVCAYIQLTVSQMCKQMIYIKKTNHPI